MAGGQSTPGSRCLMATMNPGKFRELVYAPQVRPNMTYLRVSVSFRKCQPRTNAQLK